jgi:hypothetical protein
MYYERSNTQHVVTSMEKNTVFIIVIISIFSATAKPYLYYFYDSDVYVCINLALELIIFQIHLPFNHAVPW